MRNIIDVPWQMQRRDVKMIDKFVLEPGCSSPMYVAGHKVPAGSYVNIETGRVIVVTHEDILPASFDGRVATYVQRPQTWAEINHNPQSH